MNDKKELVKNLKKLKRFFPIGYFSIFVAIIMAFSAYEYFKSIPEGGLWNEGNITAIIFPVIIIAVSVIIYIIFFRKKIRNATRNINKIIHNYDNETQ